ncbi:MAG: UDP-3-O-(3-hydroxymyristoyl)glucosamine N-acyltransferase [Acidobacteriaceae bacterium]
MKLSELAEALAATLVPGQDQTMESAAAVVIDGVSGIEAAGPAHITFVANPKYASLAHSTQAGALIVEPGFAPLKTPTLRTPNPYLAWSKVIGLFHPAPLYPPGIHPTAIIHPTATIGARAHIAAYVVVGAHCQLGEDAVLLPHSVLYPGVRAGNRLLAHAHSVIRENCQLGDDVVLQNGAIIGADGFGFAKDPQGRWIKIIQAGPAILEDSVEVQANACIDRASVGATRIAAGVKIDNLVQVGHGSSVGENTLLCAQTGLSGSTIVGKNVILAGQVGAAGHLTIGDGAVATAQSGIPSDVPPGAVVSGYPATDNRTWLRTVAALARLPELLKRVAALEKRLSSKSGPA